MSDVFTIDWPEDQFDAMIAAGQQAVLRAVELYTADFWGNLREEAPVDQGRLAGSFQMNREGDLRWHIVSGVEYAMAVWKGRPAMTIYPRKKKALYWPGAKHPVKSVHQPARAGNDFVERAWARAEQRAADFTAMALAEAGLA